MNLINKNFPFSILFLGAKNSKLLEMSLFNNNCGSEKIKSNKTKLHSTDLQRKYYLKLHCKWLLPFTQLHTLAIPLLYLSTVSTPEDQYLP